MLIVGLVMTGVGGAVLTPASLAIVTNSFRGESRGLAVGVWGGASALFSGIAPALGGLFTQELTWRWILWFNVIIGALILIGVHRAAESYDEEASRHIDYTGVALSVTGLAALVLALNEAPTPWPFNSATFILVMVAGLVLLAGFTLLERRLRDPLIDLTLFLRRNVDGRGRRPVRAELRARRGAVLPAAVPGGTARVRRAEGGAVAAPAERHADGRDAARRPAVRAPRPGSADRRRERARRGSRCCS